MKKLFSWMAIITLGFVLIFASAMGMKAQSARSDAQAGAKITAEQQAQLDRLAQLDEQLEKSRAALHTAINEYGWDSDQADDAREDLVTVRAEYRQLRRSLRASGVAVPPPSGMGAGSPRGRGGRWAGRGPGRHYGCHHCGYCGCDCGRW